MKRLLIKLGFHGVCHTRAAINKAIRADFQHNMIASMFWQGKHGADINRWRMK